MAVPYQVIDAPIGPGLDEKTHPTKVELGKLIRGENFVFNKNGTLSKRFGNQSVNSNIIGDAAALPQVELLASRQDELVAVGHQNVFSRSTEYDRWINKDLVPECIGFERKLISPSTAIMEPSIAYYDGPTVGQGGVFVVCYASNPSGFTIAQPQQVYAIIIDAVTEAVILGPIQLNSTDYINMQPRVAVVGDFAVVTYRFNVDEIRARNINLTAPVAWSAETVLITGMIAPTGFGVAYDMQPITGNTTEFALAYERAVGAPLRLHRFNAATLAVTASAILPTVHANYVGFTIHVTQGEIFWVGYSLPAPANQTWVIGALTATLAPAVPVTLVRGDIGGLFMGICRRTATTAICTFTGFIAGGFNAVVSFVTIVTTAGVLLIEHVGIQSSTASRPFMVGDKAYLYVYSTLNPPVLSDFQSTLHLCEINSSELVTRRSLRPVCTLVPRQAFENSLAHNLATRNTPSASNVTLDNQSNYHTMAITGFLNSSSTRIWMSDAYVNFNTTSRMSAELGKLVYFTGGVPSFFDGYCYSEVNFLHYPVIESLQAVTVVGGSLTALGVYSYVVNYFYLDAKGNRHRSAVSIPRQVTLGVGNNAVNLTIKTIGLTTKQEVGFEQSPIGFEVWRTLAGQTIFRKVYEDVMPFSLRNNILVTFVIYQDQASDTSISDNEIVYTTGRALDGICVPSAQCMTVHKRRIWYGCNKEIWYSTTHTENEAPIFNPALIILIDEGGPITALASMDDKLVIFKDNLIFILYGDGPTDAGTQSDFTDPQKVSSNVGCISPKSVVLSPLGLFFQSKKGIYLLTRSLDIQFVGQLVENELAIYSNVNAAVLHPEDTEVRFICSQPNAFGNSIELRFDFRVNQWSVCTYRDPVVGLTLPVKSSCINVGKYAWVTGNTVSYEDRTTHLDSGSYVSMFFEFAPLSMQGVQGYQSVSQVLLNAERKSPHDMLIQLDIDSGIVVQNKTWSNVEIAGLPKEQLEVHVGKVKNQSLIVRMLDLEPAVIVPSLETGEGYSMIGLTYRVGPNDGPQKLSNEARK